jgi:hypothetical protein
MPKTKKTPEQKFEERLDGILVCFGMTSLGIVAMGVSLLLMLVPGTEGWTFSVFIAAFSVVEVFGLTALGLFLSAPTTLRRLLKGRNEDG